MYDEQPHHESADAPDPRTDSIARHAARLLELGEATSINNAIHRAMDHLNADDAPLPSARQVRLHAQAMAQQALGEQGYKQRIIEMWQWTEELMTAIEYSLPDAETLLMGRAAQGHIDASLTINLRVYTNETIKQLSAILVEHSYIEPALETVNTTHGRFNRLRLIDVEDEHEAVIMRLKHTQNIARDHCIFTGKTLPTKNLEQLRELLTDQQ